MIATALNNEADYLLSGDQEIVKKAADLLDVYDLHNEKRLNEFRQNVLEAM
jgi:hypothetical protein